MKVRLAKVIIGLQSKMPVQHRLWPLPFSLSLSPLLDGSLLGSKEKTPISSPYGFGYLSLSSPSLCELGVMVGCNEWARKRGLAHWSASPSLHFHFWLYLSFLWAFIDASTFFFFGLLLHWKWACKFCLVAFFSEPLISILPWKWGKMKLAFRGMF